MDRRWSFTPETERLNNRNTETMSENENATITFAETEEWFDEPIIYMRRQGYPAVVIHGTKSEEKNWVSYALNQACCPPPPPFSSNPVSDVQRPSPLSPPRSVCPQAGPLSSLPQQFIRRGILKHTLNSAHCPPPAPFSSNDLQTKPSALPPKLVSSPLPQQLKRRGILKHTAPYISKEIKDVKCLNENHSKIIFLKTPEFYKEPTPETYKSSQKQPLEFLNMSKKHNEEDLKKLCINVFKHLKIENFTLGYAVALHYNDHELLSIAEDFFLKNAKEIIETTDWMNFATVCSKQSLKLLVKLL